MGRVASASEQGQAMGGTRIDFDTEPEPAIAGLWLMSAHASGRILRWHIYIRKDFTVNQLLDAIAERSKVTDSSLVRDSLVLAELMHSRLHRILPGTMTIEKLRGDDVIVAYELPVLGADGCEGDLRGCTVEAAVSSWEPAAEECHTVVCHPRFQRDELSYFDDGEDRPHDLVGIPLMFRVRSGITVRRMYELVEAGLYGAAAAHPSVDFTLCYCARARMLTTGGAVLHRDSGEELPLAVCCGGHADTTFVALACQWPERAATAPWLVHQAGNSLSRQPENFMEAVVGVDIMDLVKQIRQLREERVELRDRVGSSFSCMGSDRSGARRLGGGY